MVETKKCNKCSAVLPVSEFGRDRGKLRPSCKECFNGYARDLYHAKKKGNYSWFVVYDPLDIGGFENGVKFGERHIANMLKYGTFTIGTVLRHRIYGKLEVIKSCGTSKQKMRNRKYTALVHSHGDRLQMVEK